MQKSILLFFLLIVLNSWAQKPKQWSSSEIFSNIEKLKVQGRVLYLAAHPDDENTRFIAYCANEKRMKTAYMSLTRGDGGQNLIGSELREELGLIRTQELIMARETDGGHQYFSRANDFGYSKTPEETFDIWNKDLVLGDLIYVIRVFRPDIIVCRFPADGRGGHGHHTASAILGEEAFELAADKNAYPEQLKNGITVWQTIRIVTNTGRWWNDKISADDPHVVAEDIGTYSALIGASCNEIAALSRSKHKSQGFGSTGVRGEQLEYFEHVKGKEAQKSLFDDVNSSWSRIEGGKKIEKSIDNILRRFSIHQPEKSISALLELKKAVMMLPVEIRVTDKIVEINQLILQCGGIYAEAKVNSATASVDDSLTLDLEVIVRQSDDFKLVTVQSSDFLWNWQPNLALKRNQLVEKKDNITLLSTFQNTQPYWLREEGTLGTYSLSNQELVLLPDNGSATSFHLEFEYKAQKVPMSIPLVYKQNDPVKGEVYTPFNVVPDLSIRFDQENVLVKNREAQDIKVTFKSYVDDFSGSFNFTIPQGWSIENIPLKLKIDKKGQEKIMTFRLVALESAVSGKFAIEIRDDSKKDKRYSKSVKFIEYEHIPTQLIMSNAYVQLNVMDLKKEGSRVGYIEGAGDEVPKALTLIGYQVDFLKESDLDDLQKYDAIVLGIRALNTIDRMEFYMPKLLRYVENGGNLIVQYNTNHQLKANNFSPFSLQLSRDRVTDEKAAVTFLAPEHPVLNSPNKITKLDFDDWVQERGLYFPNQWSSEFTPILAWNDKGESSKEGALLVAKFGKGHYVYTGISFFRELPAGVPGAYRLLVNLISL